MACILLLCCQGLVLCFIVKALYNFEYLVYKILFSSQWIFKINNVTTQVDRLKTVRKKRILKPCLVQESDVSVKVRQSCSSDPFSLNSFSLTM